MCTRKLLRRCHDERTRACETLVDLVHGAAGEDRRTVDTRVERDAPAAGRGRERLEPLADARDERIGAHLLRDRALLGVRRSHLPALAGAQPVMVGRRPHDEGVRTGDLVRGRTRHRQQQGRMGAGEAQGDALRDSTGLAVHGLVHDEDAHGAHPARHARPAARTKIVPAGRRERRHPWDVTR